MIFSHWGGGCGGSLAKRAGAGSHLKRTDWRDFRQLIRYGGADVIVCYLDCWATRFSRPPPLAWLGADADDRAPGSCGRACTATRPLPPFNVNIAQSSVSGLSSPTRSSIIAITMRPARSSNGFTARCGGARRDGSRDRLSSSTKTSSCQMRRVTV